MKQKMVIVYKMYEHIMIFIILFICYFNICLIRGLNEYNLLLTVNLIVFLHKKLITF